MGVTRGEASAAGLPYRRGMREPGLCVSAVYFARALHLQRRAAGGSLDMPALVLRKGDELALAVSSERHCVGWRHPQTGIRHRCPRLSLASSSAQCAECVRRERLVPCHRCIGERCANPARRQACIQPLNHLCYLAAWAPGLLKVGVARVERASERVAEQGPRAAVFLGRADGKEIRNMEYHCRRLGYPDRLALASKLEAWLEDDVSPAALYSELARAHAEIVRRAPGRWYSAPVRVEGLPAVETLTVRPRLLKRLAGERIRGEIVALNGNACIVRSDAGELVAFEGGALVGFELRALAEREIGQAQMALTF
jgi:hypothetical protein